MVFKRYMRRTLLILAVGTAAAFVQARQTTQTLAVSATVSPSAVLGFEVLAQPLRITSGDLDRGYVDLVMKSRLQVTGGGRQFRPAVVMDMEPRPDLFKSVAVASAATKGGNGNGHANGNGNGNGHAAAPKLDTVGMDTVRFTSLGQTTSGQLAEFRYRFELSPRARAGGYDTTVSVTIDL